MKRSEGERRYGPPVREERRLYETARYRYGGFPAWVSYGADGGVVAMSLDALGAGRVRLHSAGHAPVTLTLAAGMAKRDAWDALRAAFAPAFVPREYGEEGIVVARSGVSLEFSGGKLTRVSVIDFISE